MAVFKCKMCGGDLEITQGMSVCECQYCGTKQTLPNLNEGSRKENLYDRANHFRRNNEYDKAMSIYESILNEDTSDAEAYWSLVLCKYGIEYVEDPASHKRIPTVNRAQFTSIFADEDYKSAIIYADDEQKAVYEAEAKAIDEIQKGILAISEKEDPFDVFICYKESDENGKRTPDSVLANDLYHQLTQEGFKVFYAAITLEDKLGSAYEPYIFAALNSAKVMVVLGTKPEYFNAVWVKNEWSRYLALIKSDSRRMLIPAYKGMDPYDLPEEFSHLQAQDMSKLGFMQDLIRGIKKIINSKSESKNTSSVHIAESFNAEKTLKRAYLYIEDGKNDEAEELLDKVVDADPENATAHLYRLYVEAGVKDTNALAGAKIIIADSKNYDRAMRYGDDSLKKTLSEISNENIYCLAHKIYDSATSDSDFLDAKVLFERIADYKDSAELIEQCKEKSQSAKTEQIYNEALALLNSATAPAQSSIDKLNKAISLFESVVDYEDSDKKINECKRKIPELQLAIEAKKKKTKLLAIIAGVAAVVVIVLIIIVKTVVIPSSNYNKAMELMNAKDYENAKYTFSMLGDYKDSQEQYKECVYQIACDYYDNKDLDNSNPLFEEIKGYKDSADKIHYHDWKETKTVDPTCDKKGSKELTCSCGETKTEDIAALGHDYSDATCTKPKTCKRCKATSGSALGHTDGVKCERCGEVLFETIKYSGTGDKVIKDLNIPRGTFNIKLTVTSGEADYVYARIVNSKDQYYVWVDGNQEEIFEGPYSSSNQQYLKVTGQEASWILTIDAV